MEMNKIDLEDLEYKDLIVLGDLHNRTNKVATRTIPFNETFHDLMDWFCDESGYNTSDNILLLLGDLTELSQNSGKIVGDFIDLFVNRLKFKKIIILEGNHDKSVESNQLDAFKPLSNILIIDKMTELKLNNTSYLMLPHYIPEPNEVSMEETYSSLSGDYDYIFGHIEDETRNFGKNKFCDLTNVNGKRIFGHEHSQDIASKKGGHYLGSCVLNSSKEKGKKIVGAKIDGSTKVLELFNIPKFLDYQEVSYPDPLPKSNTKYVVWTVLNSLNKQESIEHYTAEALKRNEIFYYRQIVSKSVKSDKVQDKKASDKKSDEEHFANFSTKKKLDKAVHDRCIDLVKRVVI